MLKPYDEYKEVHIPWIKPIPEHWEINRAKNMFQKESRTVNPTDDVVTCFRDGVVTLRKKRRTTGFTESLKEIGYQGIRVGDLVIHVMDAFAGAVGVSDSDGKGTPVYSVCSAKGDFNNYYYAYCIREMAKTGFIQSLYRGIRERSSDFRFEVFARQFLPIPPREEQDQIVRYLDWKVSQINKLINAKKKQIALLQEQKQAIINQAVTKGLNPNVEMKDSGVEWIGDIPRHWEFRKLRTLTNAPFQYGANESGISFSDDLPRYIRITDISLTGTLKSENRQSLTWEKASKYLLSPGDVLFARSGATVGKSFIYFQQYGDACFAGYLIRFKADSNLILPEFVYTFTQGSGYSVWLKQIFIQATIQNISAEKYKNLQIPVPPISEQYSILQFINCAITPVEKTMHIIDQEIDLFYEYRIRLISDVVTGQIDVRDVEIPEYEAAEEIIEDNDLSDDEILETEE